MASVVRLHQPSRQPPPLRTVFPLREVRVGASLVFRSSVEDVPDERGIIAAILPRQGSRWSKRPGSRAWHPLDRVRVEGDLWLHELTAGYLCSAGRWLLVPEEDG